MEHCAPSGNQTYPDLYGKPASAMSSERLGVGWVAVEQVFEGGKADTFFDVPVANLLFRWQWKHGVVVTAA